MPDTHLEAKLPSLIGQKIYAVGFSRLYKPTSTIEELSSIDNRLAELSFIEVPLLEPLTILKAKYLPEINAVIIKIAFTTGSEGIIYTKLDNSGTSTEDLLSRVAQFFLTSIPKDLTPKQLDAIKRRSVLRG